MAWSAGVFGKLPRHGDFIRRGMEDAVADRWDAWLSDELERQRRRLGEAFDATHDVAPCLRFLLRSGENWRLGVVCPSLDAVGRRFFLVVELEGLSDAEALAWGAEAARRLEDVAYQSLSERLDADEVLARARLAAEALDRLDAEAWAAAGARASGNGAWWRGAGERAPAGHRPGAWLEEGVLDMMFVDAVREVAP
jgi:type VI secretion system protein ImpM